MKERFLRFVEDLTLSIWQKLPHKHQSFIFQNILGNHDFMSQSLNMDKDYFQDLTLSIWQKLPHKYQDAIFQDMLDDSDFIKTSLEGKKNYFKSTISKFEDYIKPVAEYSELIIEKIQPDTNSNDIVNIFENKTVKDILLAHIDSLGVDENTHIKSCYSNYIKSLLHIPWVRGHVNGYEWFLVARERLRTMGFELPCSNVLKPNSIESENRIQLLGLDDEKIWKFKDAEISIQTPSAFAIILDEIFARQEYFFEATSDKPFVIDAGSNIGLSIVYFKTLYPNAKVVGFEPLPEAYNLAIKNTRIYDDVEIHQLALSKENGQIEFIIPENEPLAGCLENRRQPKGNFEKVTVESRMLSSYISGEVDMLKMDIEGAELEVLEEIQDKLHLINNVFCEYHHDSKKDRTALTKILSILDTAGFNCHLSKTPWTAQNQAFRPMKHCGDDYSASIWAKRIH